MTKMLTVLMLFAAFSAQAQLGPLHFKTEGETRKAPIDEDVVKEQKAAKTRQADDFGTWRCVCENRRPPCVDISNSRSMTEAIISVRRKCGQNCDPLCSRQGK